MNEFHYNTEFADIKLVDGIMYVTYLKGPITLEKAKELVAARIKISNGKSYPVYLTDGGLGLNGIDRDAREYMAGKDATSLISACAFYSDSTFNKILISFFLKISYRGNVANFETKVYTDKAEAIKWLQNFVSK